MRYSDSLRIQIFHNYIRHQALNGKTSAELAGIKIQGEDKWLIIIQDASRNENSAAKKQTWLGEN